MGEDESTRPVAESRWISVLDVDLVGFTTLSEGYPEAMPHLVSEYQKAARRAIDKYAGLVKNVAGDGVTATFGFPHAMEATARRSVLAAQEILDSVAELSAEMERHHGFTVQARVGIDSGRVQLIEGYQDAEIVGKAINRAGRIQAVADPDTILVGEPTREQLGADFLFEERGPFELKGFTTATPLFRVIGAAPAARSLTPLVGREPERQTIRTMWGAALGAEGPPVLLISGEAGMGKSRLASYALDLGESEGLARAGESSPYQTSATFHPIGRMLARVAAPDPNAPSEVRLKGLVAELELAGFADEQSRQPLVPLFAPLLDIRPGLYEALRMEPDKLFVETMNAVLAWWRGLAAAAPLVLLIEDLHWAEPSTLALIDRVLDERIAPNVLLVLTIRDEAFAASPTELATKDRGGWAARRQRFMAWREHEGVRHLGIGPLDADATLELARSIDLSARPDDAMLEYLLTDLGGVPLYVEEVVRTAATVPEFLTRLEELRAQGELAAGLTPDQLHDILLTRLESPGVDLPLAQQAAAIGRRVDLTLLGAVTERDDADIREGIASLVDAGVLLPPEPDDHLVQFRHVLIRDEAYATMSDQARVDTHRRIGAELVARHGNADPTADAAVAPAAGPIAHHLERARMQEAVPWHIAAGRYALSRGANLEALAILDHAIELMEGWPDGPNPFAELLARLTRGTAWVAIEGFGSPHANEDYERSEQLSAVMAGMPERASVLFALGAFKEITGARPQAMELLNQVRNIVEQDPFVGPQIDAEYEAFALVHTYFTGDYTGARERYEQALAKFEARAAAGQPEVFEAWRLPQDPLVACWAYMAHIYWALGEAGKARDVVAAAKTRLDRLEYPGSEFTRAWLLAYDAWVHQLAGSYQEALDGFTATHLLSDRHGFDMWLRIADAQRTVTQGLLEPSEAAADAVTEARKRVADLGVASYQPFFMAAEAEVRAAVGQAKEALALLDEAIAEGDATDERIQEAEIYRMRGRLRIAEGDPWYGIGDLEKAYEIAGRQGSHLYGLRAALDLMALPDDVRPDSARPGLEQALAAIADPDAYPEAGEASRLLGA